MFSILIILESPGSPFYLQKRVGLNGSYFNIYKLRSMKKNAEKSGPQWARQNDPRVTIVGGFIRKTRIDEFPQFLNVLKGEMSIIGPRPERPFFTAKFHHNIPGFTNRLAVKPGITGWAQINGGYDLTPEQKLRFDLYYINYLNFIFDLKILIKTIKIIITGKGAR